MRRYHGGEFQGGESMPQSSVVQQKQNVNHMRNFKFSVVTLKKVKRNR